MNSLHSRSSTADTVNIDIYSWLRAGAAVTLIAACLIVLGMRTWEGPVLVTRVGESAGSVADSYVELRHRIEGTLPAVRVTNASAEIAMAPRVNEPYPASEALATFQSLLLQVLPRLPDDLEYRFMGRHLIIRDSRTNLIVDYLPEVMSAAEVTP